MTWTRVATAAVLIPFVVGLVVWGSTAWVALALALVVVLALFEYFSLGDAIGRARSAAAAFRVGDYLGGRHGGLFCGPCGGQASICATSEPEENVGRCRSKFCRIAAGGFGVHSMAEPAASSFAGHGCRRKHC